MRKQRLLKVQQLKMELERQQEAKPQAMSKVTSSFAAALRKKIFQMDAEMHRDDNSILLARLREWDLHKHDYQLVEF